MLSRAVLSEVEVKSNVEREQEGTASVVVVDQDAIEQVILNLVTNARDAAPEGGLIVLRLRGPVTDLDDAPAGAPPLIRYGADEADLPGPFVILWKPLIATSAALRASMSARRFIAASPVRNDRAPVPAAWPPGTSVSCARDDAASATHPGSQERVSR